MANWYASREALKRAVSAAGSDVNAAVDRLLESASRDIDNATRRWFLPRTLTRLYRWPPWQPSSTWTLWLDADLQSISALSAGGTAITNYFLEPQQWGPPYNRIEIDLSSADVYQSGNTPQRSVSVAGDWGCSQFGSAPETVAAGTLAAALNDTTGTTVTVSDASLIDVGDTLLVDTERMFVSERAVTDTTATLNGDLTATQNQQAVTVSNGTLVHQGEVIQLDNERMLISSIAGNVLTVTRAYDGSTLAAHTGAVKVYAFRTLTVTRGENGSTAATHLNAAGISRYRPPHDIQELCLGLAIAAYYQEKTGYGRPVGEGPASPVADWRGLASLRDRVFRSYRRDRSAAI